MAKIRHIALLTNSQELTAQFYKDATGATPPHRVLPRDGRQAETFATDLLGIKLDLSPGWSTK